MTKQAASFWFVMLFPALLVGVGWLCLRVALWRRRK